MGEAGGGSVLELLLEGFKDAAGPFAKIYNPRRNHHNGKERQMIENPETELQVVAESTWNTPDYQVVETSLEVTAYYLAER